MGYRKYNEGNKSMLPVGLLFGLIAVVVCVLAIAVVCCGTSALQRGKPQPKAAPGR